MCAVGFVATLGSGRAVTGPAPRDQEPVQFGGAFAGLGATRQRLIDDWVTRFNQATGQTVESAEFYDTILRVSAKTTFDAVTHALMTTTLTDDTGANLGGALDLIEHVDTVRGSVNDTSSDRQFRMYVRLTDRAMGLLTRSQEFKRSADNSIYHKGYPINFRQQGGSPSMQVSIALDERRADIDVDYRSATFPVSLFNGHLSSSNSDVRAGNNADRHSTRWLGLQNWWRSFFGARLKAAEDDPAAKDAFGLPPTPRAGDKGIDVMVHDFLTAWLVEADIIAAMGYIAPRAYACLAQEADDPAEYDRGMAPFQLMQRLKAAHEAVGAHTSLVGLTLGVRLALPGLRVVSQPHHPQVVVYDVPDDIGAAFDCQERLTLGDPAKIPRAYGKYRGAVFYLNTPGGKDHTVALLWARDGGYWKIVSWKTEPDDDEVRALHTLPDVKPVRIPADASLVTAARGFLENWLIRKDYDAAFRYLSEESYPCYDLMRAPNAQASTSPEDAGRRIRAALERTGTSIGAVRDLNTLLAARESSHQAIRMMDHSWSRVFALASLPDGLTEAAGCAVRARGQRFDAKLSGAYGRGFGMSVSFRTRAGETPVLTLLWRRVNDAWRITAYDVEYP